MLMSVKKGGGRRWERGIKLDAGWMFVDMGLDHTQWFAPPPAPFPPSRADTHTQCPPPLPPPTRQEPGLELRGLAGSRGMIGRRKDPCQTCPGLGTPLHGPKGGQGWMPVLVGRWPGYGLAAPGWHRASTSCFEDPRSTGNRNAPITILNLECAALARKEYGVDANE